MAITAPVALSEPATYVGAPLQSQLVEQNLDVTNGNKMRGGPRRFLYARNTTAGAIGIDFEKDVQGAPAAKHIDGSVTASKVNSNAGGGGVRIFGPFDGSQGELVHDTSDAADNGFVLFKQQSGTAGQLVCSPVTLG